MGILEAAEFVIWSTKNSIKGYTLGQWLFGLNVILPIKNLVDWKLIRQQRHMQIDRDNTRENKYRVDYDYKVRDKVMLTNHTA